MIIEWTGLEPLIIMPIVAIFVKLIEIAWEDYKKERNDKNER